jgi:hypothetical protein
MNPNMNMNMSVLWYHPNQLNDDCSHDRNAVSIEMQRASPSKGAHRGASAHGIRGGEPEAWCRQRAVSSSSCAGGMRPRFENLDRMVPRYWPVTHLGVWFGSAMIGS